MSDSDWKEIKSARPSNIARTASNSIFIIIYSVYDFGFALYFGVLVFFISLFWFWFIENRFKTYKKYPLLWYIPASIDICFITVCVYYTGLSYSPALLGYVYSTATSSIDLIRARGLYATFGNCFTFLAVLILTKFNVFPYTNIVNQSVTEITLFSILLSTALLFLACVTANSVIYQIYFQFHEKNNELSSSLDKINLLKLQQDADYALTARLMEPFVGNYAKSKSVEIEFLLRQKKSFTFKNQTLEIGGDLLIADELYFNNRKFIFFMNADAMGKSMQGACGALVLGVICKSILANSESNRKDNNASPQEWLINSAREMHRIFESFEGTMLASVFIGVLEERTGNLYHINAEHPEAILYRDETATLLKDHHDYRKIGTLGALSQFPHVEYTQLVAGDVLFIGSDGKDDLILNSTKLRTINQDEFLFPRSVQKRKGNLSEIVAELKTFGDFSDDLSILKITYHGFAHE
ncbi:MAG TPA: PP2C family protein-serine/threonine phosphatase [Leptospiraceae bacterium]|nr:PP2C family protein-serine/threonine phosphatase [Leptospiraceae bacterium]HRG74935.1 PP2C family protein-serine/threonine phosphatase [Leptospiraceae bacterium]